MPTPLSGVPWTSGGVDDMTADIEARNDAAEEGAGGGGGLSEAEVTAIAQAETAAVVDAAPGALNTLNELAAALGDDPGFAAAVTAAIESRASLTSPTFTGNVVVPDADAPTEALNRQTGDGRYPLLIEYPGNGDNYQPDAYPASPASEDDEFEGGGALDAKWGWSSGTQPTAVNQTAFPGHLLMQVQAAESAAYLRQTYAPGAGVAFTIAAKVAVAAKYNDNANVGIGLAVLDGSDSPIARLAVIGDGAATVVGAGRVYDGTTAQAIGNGMSSWLYFAISRDASNVYRLAWSHDGLIWNIFSTPSSSTTVGRIGLWVFNSGGTADRWLLVDWFRRIAGSSFPFALGR